jgi:hypothetical protein
MKEHLGLIGIRITALMMSVALIGFAGPIAAQAESSSPARNVASPAHRSTASGEDLGPLEWHPIEAAASHVRYDDPGRVKTRKAAIIKGRYTEFLTLGAGGILTYAQLLDKQRYFETNHDVSLGGQSRSSFLRARQVVFDPAAIKWAGRVEYLVSQTAKATCFVYHATFGVVPSRPDQEVYGNSCFGPQKSAAALEREMFALLAAAHFPDGYGNYSLTLDIPAAP